MTSQEAINRNFKVFFEPVNSVIKFKENRRKNMIMDENVNKISTSWSEALRSQKEIANIERILESNLDDELKKRMIQQELRAVLISHALVAKDIDNIRTHYPDVNETRNEIIDLALSTVGGLTSRLCALLALNGFKSSALITALGADYTVINKIAENKDEELALDDLIVKYHINPALDKAISLYRANRDKDGLKILRGVQSDLKALEKMLDNTTKEGC